MTSKKADIFELPPEFFEWVAENTSPADLLQLRLVCKDIRDKTLNLFLESHFKNRAVLLSSEYSLRTLLAISENESCARALRMIDFSIEEAAFTDHNRPDGDRRPPHRLPLDKRYQRLQEEKVTKGLIEEQKRFCESNARLHLLTVIFCRIRSVQRHPITIRLVDRSTACKAPYYTKTLEQISGMRLWMAKHANSTLPLLIEALSLSGVKIDNFTTLFDNSCFVYDLGRVRPLLQQPMHALTVFMSLRKLHLVVAAFDKASIVDVIKDFFNAMPSASSIEDFSLHTPFPWMLGHNPGSQQWLSSCLTTRLTTSFPRLKVLAMQGVEIATDSLNKIIHNCSNLERLHFHASRTHSPEPPFGITLDQNNTERFSRTYPCEWSANASLRGILVPPCTAIELEQGRETWKRLVLKVEILYGFPY